MEMKFLSLIDHTVECEKSGYPYNETRLVLNEIDETGRAKVIDLAVFYNNETLKKFSNFIKEAKIPINTINVTSEKKK